jgi:hypothetical protein
LSKGKHRRRHVRRVVITTGIAALAVLGTGVGFAMAQSPPVTVQIAGDPVIAPEQVAPPAPSQRPPAPSRIYIAKEPDSLWSIAASQCHDGKKWSILASANHIRYPYPVVPGQRLVVTC